MSEIVSRGGANIFGIISDMCKMLRLLNIDVDNVFDGADAELDDTDNDWSRFIDGCTELAIVCQESPPDMRPGSDRADPKGYGSAPPPLNQPSSPVVDRQREKTES